jgi:hypothetical protein
MESVRSSKPKAEHHQLVLTFPELSRVRKDRESKMVARSGRSRLASKALIALSASIATDLSAVLAAGLDVSGSPAHEDSASTVNLTLTNG